MLDVLLENCYLTEDVSLDCRSVCILWKESVDLHYKTAKNLSITFKGQQAYNQPKVVIFVPIDASFEARMNGFANHGTNPFVGSRLTLKIGNPKRLQILDEVTSTKIITSDQAKHVWKFVQNLEICENEEKTEEDDDEFDDEQNDWYKGYYGTYNMLKPFLENMPNVKSVFFTSRVVGAECLSSLPNLDALQRFSVGTFYDYDMTDYNEVVGQCYSNLRLLSSTGILEGDISKLSKIYRFDFLEELSIAGFVSDLTYNAFPNLKVVCIQYQFEDDFYAKLVEFSESFDLLDEIQVNCVQYDVRYKIPVLKNVPKPGERKCIKKLTIVNVKSTFSTAEFTTVIKHLGKVFPYIKCLKTCKEEESDDDVCVIC